MVASGASQPLPPQLLVWNHSSLSPVQQYTEHLAAVKAIAWSPHQHGLLASGGGTADRCIRFWNTLTGQPLQCIDTGSQVCNLAWSKHANELVSAGPAREGLRGHTRAPPSSSLDGLRSLSAKSQGQRSLGVRAGGGGGRSPGPAEASHGVLRFSQAPATLVVQTRGAWMCPSLTQTPTPPHPVPAREAPGPVRRRVSHSVQSPTRAGAVTVLSLPRHLWPLYLARLASLRCRLRCPRVWAPDLGSGGARVPTAPSPPPR